MNKKEKIIHILPFVAYIVLMLMIHLHFRYEADDVALINNTLQPTIHEELISVFVNFTRWSSRVLVNLPIHIMLHLDYRVWFVLEMFMLAVIIFSLSYIFIDNDNPRKNMILVTVTLMFQFYYVTSAGWITTTMTYIWPLAAGLFAMTSARMWSRGVKYKWYHVVLFALTTIYAANSEGLSVFLTLYFGAYVIYSIKIKRVSAVLIMQLAAAVINIMLHALTPGNQARIAAEMAVFFTDYSTMSLLDKLELGFSSTFYRNVFDIDYLFFFLTLFIAVAVWQKHKRMLFRLIGIMPLLMSIFFGFFLGYVVGERMGILIFQQRLFFRGTITEGNYFSIYSYIPIAILFFMGIMLIASLYLIFGESFRTILASVMLFGGLGGRMVTAFSASVWASGDRPYTIMFFSFIMIAAMVVNEIDFKALKSFGTVLTAAAIVIGVYNCYCVNVHL